MRPNDIELTQVEWSEDKPVNPPCRARLGSPGGGGPGTTMSPLIPQWELGFAHTIRIGAPNLCNGVRAAKAAQACFAGQQALLTKERVVIEPLKVNIV